MNNLLFYCRPGFEKEIAAEIQDKAVALECFGFSRVKDNSGYAILELWYEAADADKLARRLPFRELVFARQMMVMTHELTGMDLADRIAPIIAATAEYSVCGEKCASRRRIPMMPRS